jgi:hypothetical protein
MPSRGKNQINVKRSSLKAFWVGFRSHIKEDVTMYRILSDTRFIQIDTGLAEGNGKKG